jgi:hypothetical protein
MSQTEVLQAPRLGAMENYGILNNRKRAILALVHSVVFLGIAMMGLASAPKAGLLYPSRAFTAGNFSIFAVYAIVSGVLWILTAYTRCARERMYFALCSSSASVGLVRAIIGDPVAHVGPVLRVVLLGTAVALGFSIMGYHGEQDSSACDRV